MRNCEHHGMVNTPEYISWMNMIQRCCNPKNKYFKNYGAKDIVICDRWVNSFVNFFKDMGLKPFLKAQIDRIDNGGNYEPGNCRWISSAENNRNRKDNVLNWFTVKSIRRVYSTGKFSRKQLALIYRLNISTINSVIYKQNWKET